MSDTMRARFNSAVVDLMGDDPLAVVVLAAIGASGFSAETHRRFRGRIIDVAIREQAMIGVQEV